MRHSIRSSGAGDVAPGMATFSSALLSSPTASQALPAGNYRTSSTTPLRSSPSVDAPIVVAVPAGTTIVPLGTVSNYFADVIAQVGTAIGTRGWVSVANLTSAPQQPAGGVPGGPLTGANTPPTPPGAPSATYTTPATTPATSGIPTWLFPAGAAALLGWFFLVEQKKKGRRR